MKSRLPIEKAASSVLLSATLGCLAANFSPAQAASELNPTLTATPVESSAEELPKATDVSTLAKDADASPTASQPTVADLAKPTDESVAPASSGNTVSETPQVAIATPSHPQAQLGIRQSELKITTDSTPSVEEANVKDVVKPPRLEAQAVPTELDAGESASPEVAPVDSLDSTEAPEPMDQVTNVSQLSDVSPGDWAYEALRNLVERYGCIAGYPDGTFRGNRAMTRYEFAAGLNSCLQQIERLIAGAGSDRVPRSDLEKLQRLVNEFQSELTALKGRVDNLEGRTASLESHQFSTTTKLFGQAIVGLQGHNQNSFDFFLDRFTDTSNNVNVISNVQLSLFTQFSPRSLLLTGLQAGSGRSGSGSYLDRYVNLGFEGDTNNDLQLSDLNFRQLIGSKFALIFGPVGVNPVNVFRGVNRVESAGFGPLSRFAQRNPIINIGGGAFPGSGAGIGFDWQLATRFSLQGVYSVNGANDPQFGGLFGGEEGTTSAGAQLVVSPTDNIDLSFQYINSYSPSGNLFTGVGDDVLAVQTINDQGFLRAPLQTNAFGVGLEWRVTPRFTFGGWGGYTTSDLQGGS
ncbi:MAG TPA: iron uptake porin, partial [Allocoleopsis sp.]